MITDAKKEAFFQALEQTFGNITKACKVVGIAYSTVKLWRNTDEEFAKRFNETIENAEEQFLDFVENKLVDLINEKDTAATIFALKTKGKKRGYIEKTEIVSRVVLDKTPSWFDQNQLPEPNPMLQPPTQDINYEIINDKNESAA